MQLITNPHRHQGLELGQDIPFPSVNAAAVSTLLAQCPAHSMTPLANAPGPANQIGIAQLHIKDERNRMGLGSFKALGAAYVIACDASATGASDLSNSLEGKTYITASAGNHGLSVAAGARVFGAKAVIVLSRTVPASFAARLEAMGASVLRAGDTYEASMQAAMDTATMNNWELLSDSSWHGYTERPHRLMEGYLQMAAEAFDALPAPPTHIFLQAGVGGLAGAVAALSRDHYGDEPVIIIVEPDFAPALFESIKAGKPVTTEGPVSAMGRLDCKEPSLIALKGLSRDADAFMTITEQEAISDLAWLDQAGIATSPSGGAGISGLAALDDAGRSSLGLTSSSRVLAFLSEGPEA